MYELPGLYKATLGPFSEATVDRMWGQCQGAQAHELRL